MTSGTNERPETPAPIFGKLRQLVDEVWQIETFSRGPEGQPRPYPLYSLLGPLADPKLQSQGQQWLAHTLARLLDEVEGKVNELSRQAALVYFRPADWIEPYTYDYTLPEAQRFAAAAHGEIIQTVLFEWVRMHPSIATRALLTERVATLLRGSGGRGKPDLYRPTLLDCLNLLLADPSPETTEILVQLMAGELGLARKDSVEEPELRKAAPAAYLRLWQAGFFDYYNFRRSMFSLPGAFHDLSRPLEKKPAFFRTLPPTFALELQSYAHQLTTELAEELPSGQAEAAALLKGVGYLEGVTWLLLACAYVEEKGLESLPDMRSSGPEAAATRLCQTHRSHNHAEDDAQTVEFLRHYKPATLRAVFPHARAYQDLIEQAQK